MKTFKIFFTLLVVLFSSACEKDGNLITISSLKSNELMATSSDVVLTHATSTQIALSLAWTSQSLTVSDPGVSVPNVTQYVLQATTHSDFSGTLVESLESSLSRAFTGFELNAMAKSLLLEPNTATPVYFRLSASAGANMVPVYSNVVAVQLTPYEIDMRPGLILDKDQVATEFSLYSPLSDGHYTGFMGATGWYNFFVKEGDGVIWGNDGVTGTAFVLSSENNPDKRWNCWFPGITGCYFVDFNTNTKVWAATLIPELKATGDLAGTMIFDRPNVKWVLPVTITETSLTIQLSADGKLYNRSTGDSDLAAESVVVHLVANGDHLELGSAAAPIALTAPKAGEYTLVVDLKNAAKWTVSLVEGSDVPDEIAPELFLAGIEDGEGSWTFNRKAFLYNEETLGYACVAQIDAPWGYSIHKEADNWADKYTLLLGDANAGTMEWKGDGGDIPAPADGLYLVDISLKNLTYSHLAIENQLYVVGLDDNWDLDKLLLPTGTPGEFSGSVTFQGASPWGFKILLDTSWNHHFGGSEGKLYYNGDNITDDATMTPGTYTLTVNLLEQTYRFNQ